VADVIALFPLTHVLMPGLALPLHVFEPRYRELLSDVCTDDGERSFGVVALRRGSEAGSRWPSDGPDLVAVGTLAEIIEVQPYDDGASDLLAVGSRRFRLCELITEGKPYLRASVEWLEESDGALSPAHIGVTRRLCRDYAELFEALTGRAYDEELPTDGNLLSYHVAGRLPLPQSDRQAMLEEPTAEARLRHAIKLLRRELCLLQATSSVAVAPPVLQLAVHPN